jgi:hypothetical protein
MLNNICIHNNEFRDLSACIARSAEKECKIENKGRVTWRGFHYPPRIFNCPWRPLEYIGSKARARSRSRNGRDGKGNMLPQGVYAITVSRAGSRQSAAIVMGE